MVAAASLTAAGAAVVYINSLNAILIKEVQNLRNLIIFILFIIIGISSNCLAIGIGSCALDHLILITPKIIYAKILDISETQGFECGSYHIKIQPEKCIKGNDTDCPLEYEFISLIINSQLKNHLKLGSNIFIFLYYDDKHQEYYINRCINGILPASDNLDSSYKNPEDIIFTELSKIHDNSKNELEKKELLILMSKISTPNTIKVFKKLLLMEQILKMSEFNRRIALSTLAKVEDDITYINDLIKEITEYLASWKDDVEYCPKEIHGETWLYKWGDKGAYIRDDTSLFTCHPEKDNELLEILSDLDYVAGMWGDDKCFKRTMKYKPIYKAILSNCPNKHGWLDMSITGLATTCSDTDDVIQLSKYIRHPNGLIRHKALKAIGKFYNIDETISSVTSYCMPLSQEVIDQEAKLYKQVIKRLGN